MIMMPYAQTAKEGIIQHFGGSSRKGVTRWIGSATNPMSPPKVWVMN